MLALNFISLSFMIVTQEIIIGAIILLIFNLEFDWRKVLPFALFTGLSSSISITFLPQAGALFNMIIFISMTLLALLVFYKFKLLKSIATMCIVYLMKLIISTLGLPLLKLIHRPDFNAINATLTERLISIGIGTLLFLIIALIIYLFRLKIDMPEDFNKKTALIVVINAIFSVFLLYPNAICLQNNIDKDSYPLLIYNSLSLVIIVLINTFNFIRFGKIELLKQNVEYQNLYIQSLNNMLDGLREFKHDYNNMLQVMQGYISANDMEGLKNYHSQLLTESRKINNIPCLNSYIKDTPPIYGLLLSKASYSEIKNVSFTVTAMCKLKISNIKIYDFCKVLGILLDNAIEAAAESEKKFVELIIGEKPDKSALFIEVSNSCAGTVDTTTIFNDGYSTKEGHMGFGLWNVQKIISKYKNCKLHTKACEKYFSQKIEIMHNNVNA